LVIWLSNSHDVVSPHDGTHSDLSGRLSKHGLIPYDMQQEKAKKPSLNPRTTSSDKGLVVVQRRLFVASGVEVLQAVKAAPPGIDRSTVRRFLLHALELKRARPSEGCAAQFGAPLSQSSSSALFARLGRCDAGARIAQ
jgi:hypothetical protein